VEGRKQKAEGRKPSVVAALFLGKRVSRSGAFISRSVTGEGSLAMLWTIQYASGALSRKFVNTKVNQDTSQR
jgi:hypothetical protein